MRVFTVIIGLVFWVALFSAARTEAGKSIRVDDFEDGTTQGWTSGGANPNPPVWEASGGPDGAGDGYLLITANGSLGAGGNLVAFNTDQWSGNYARAGTVGIAAKVRNLGDSDLSIRLLFEGDGGGLLTVAAVSLPAAGDWQRVVWPIPIADPLFENVTKLRIVHAPGLEGSEAVAALLGVDDIRPLSGDLCRDADLPHRARGMCRAYCNKLDCAGEPRRGRKCDVIEWKFEDRVGALPPCARDRDGDGWIDELDNCPDDFNPDLADRDGDGVGDACDVCPEDSNPDQDGSVCGCPCYTGAEVAELISTLRSPGVYQDLTCVDDRPDVKPLTYISAIRTDGEPCGAESQDCSVLAAEFTEDSACQYNPPRPDAQVLIGEISERERENCRDLILETAEVASLVCN